MATSVRFALKVAAGSVAAAGVAAALSLQASSLPGAGARMRYAESSLDSLASAASYANASSASREAVLSMAYVERLRLGMGSPFRLMEQVLRDPRIEPGRRETVAWGLVGRLLRGDAYAVDPSVLAHAAAGASPEDVERAHELGIGYLDLIERAILSHDNPRVGELSVRLAFALGAAEGNAVVTPRVARTATDVAAQMRDRVLASRDLRDLLARANRARGDGGDLFGEITRARADRRLGVEAPVLARLSAEDEVWAVRRAGKLLDQLRALPGQNDIKPRQPFLSALRPGATEPLRELGRSLPPQSAAVIAMAGERNAIRVAAAAASFDTLSLFAANNEETLVAAYAALTDGEAKAPPAVSRSVLAVAVALRSYAQERAWFPGDPGAKVADLLAEFGLADVTFSPDVPKQWRPYYTGVLASALRDMKRVFPGYSPTGLAVRIESAPLPDGALAMHDPRTRTLRLTLATPAGALAHELAHDMDWAAARRLFGSAGGYSTDRAVNAQSGKLASSMRGLTAAHPTSGAGNVGAVRPTEVFARNVEWLVATVLAQSSRTNGNLSGVQDAVIAGPTAGRLTAVGPRGTAALVAALSQMTFLPDSVAERFVDSWGDSRVLDLAFLLNRMLAIPVATEDIRTALADTSSSLWGLVSDAGTCFAEGTEYDQRSRARATLREMAVESRSRGAVIRYAASVSSAQRDPRLRGILGEAPYVRNAGSELARVRALISRAMNDEAFSALGFTPAVPSPFVSPGC